MALPCCFGWSVVWRWRYGPLLAGTDSNFIKVSWIQIAYHHVWHHSKGLLTSPCIIILIIIIIIILTTTKGGNYRRWLTWWLPAGLHFLKLSNVFPVGRSAPLRPTAWNFWGNQKCYLCVNWTAVPQLSRSVDLQTGVHLDHSPVPPRPTPAQHTRNTRINSYQYLRAITARAITHKVRLPLLLLLLLHSLLHTSPCYLPLVLPSPRLQ